MSLVSAKTPNIIAPRYSERADTNPFANSFFYRSHLKWNLLSIEIRKIMCPNMFKIKVVAYLWNKICSDEDAYESDENDFLLLDPG